MQQRRSLILPVLVVMLVVMFACVVLESQFHPLGRVYADRVLDNRPHYLPCEQLVIPEEMYTILKNHQDVVSRIEQVNPGLVGVEVDTLTCPGKADLIIWYASHQDRQSIEAIIGSDSFFGLPYQMENR
jgi:hypothetical protein